MSALSRDSYHSNPNSIQTFSQLLLWGGSNVGFIWVCVSSDCVGGSPVCICQASQGTSSTLFCCSGDSGDRVPQLEERI